MFSTVTLPMWLLVLILLFAAVTLATHFIGPTLRWFLRARMERVVARLNERLDVPIQPFKLARRHDTILRLTYDPKVAEAIAAHAHSTGLREDAAFELARKYAREIVPGFSATAYFGFAIRAARWLSEALFRVRVLRERPDILRSLDPEATIVFVMNHRSNMDYVLVTYLAAERSALAYAVGEWARVWPLSALFRAMGAYFIRRRSRNALYRRVLARYVQMATEGGVTQAIFPEGGLSLTGRMGKPKLGLLSYILAAQEATGREVVFVPVALNYDRVIEDRMLVEAHETGNTRFRGTILSGSRFALRWAARRVTGRIRRFGFAAVSYGEPLAASGIAPGPERAERVAEVLIERLSAAVPVLPVPLACHVLRGADGPLTRTEITARIAVQARVLDKRGAAVCMDMPEGALAPLDILALRNMVSEGADGWSIAPGKAALVAFYAASVAHHFPADPAATAASFT